MSVDLNHYDKKGGHKLNDTQSLVLGTASRNKPQVEKIVAQNSSSTPYSMTRSVNQRLTSADMENTNLRK